MMNDFLVPDFLWRALLGGAGIALLAGPLGCFVVWRRMSYFGETLAHSSFLGVGLGLALHLEPMFGVVAIGACVAVLLARRHTSTALAEDTLLGLLAHTSLALGLVLLSTMESMRLDLFSYLFGDILALRSEELLWVALANGIGWTVLTKIWAGLLAVTVHEELAAVEGRRIDFLRLVLMLMLAMFVALAMKLVGILLAVALLIVPAAAARRLACTPLQMATGASVIGVLAVILGLTASLQWDTPTGPSIVVAAALLFLLIRALVRPR